MNTKKLKKVLTAAKQTEAPIKPDSGLSTGSTLLNLAITGSHKSGFLPGHIYLLVGDSSSGKTWLSLTCLAEAARRADFDEYRFIFDNAEDGALMNIERYFGRKVLERLEPPRRVNGEPVYSETVEDFYDNVDDAGKDGRPFIYILDSMDVLPSRDELDTYEEQKTARRNGKVVSGTYGTAKAKANSSGLRRATLSLRGTKNILIVIFQTRDNIGFGAQFNPKTKSGGRAPTFYATVELWSSVKGEIKKSVKGKQRQIGTLCQVKVKKNRVAGKNRTVEVPIYWSHGIDDIGSLVDFLVEEGHWKKKGSLILADELEISDSEEGLIQEIEKLGWEHEIGLLAEDCWKEIESACELNRKKRYE